MSVSLINGHIDPNTSRMTPQEALAWVEDYEKAIKEEQAIVNNGDEFHVEALKVCEVVKQALEKQIPKKPEILNYIPLLNSGWKYQCPNCGCAVGKNKNLEFAYEEYLEPYQSNCMSCGQALDWGDTE